MKTILAITISLSLAAPMTWADDRVFANANGKSIAAFPDVLVAPQPRPATPPGVPIPYPNIGNASDTLKGTKKVSVRGQDVALKNRHQFLRQVPQGEGAEPNRPNQGKTYFAPHSFDVKIESKEHFDPGPFCHHR